VTLSTIVAFAADIDIGEVESEMLFNGVELDELDEAGIDPDDFFPDTERGLEDDDEPEVFSHILQDEKKEYLKTALIAALRPARWKQIPVRPFRVQGKTMDGIYDCAKDDFLALDTVNGADEVVAKDLLAFLVQADNTFCIAVLEVMGFRYKKEKQMKLRIDRGKLTNEAANFKVIGQIIELDQNPEDVNIWDWTQYYIHLDVTARTARLTRKQFVVEVSALLVFPVVHRIAKQTSSENPELLTTWRLEGDNLTNILNTAWDSLNGSEGDDLLSNLMLLPNVVNPMKLPYKDRTGELICRVKLKTYSLASIDKGAFVIQNIPNDLQPTEKLLGATIVDCKLCKKGITINKMCGHVGQHILLNARGILEDSSVRAL
jgi:hypothetical protein